MPTAIQQEMRRGSRHQNCQTNQELPRQGGRKTTGYSVRRSTAGTLARIPIEPHLRSSVAKTGVSSLDDGDGMHTGKSDSIDSEPFSRIPCMWGDASSDYGLGSFVDRRRDKELSRAERVAMLKRRDMATERSTPNTSKPPSPETRRQCMGWIFESLNLPAKCPLPTATSMRRPKETQEILESTGKVRVNRSIVQRRGKQGQMIRSHGQTA
jgi:hypothetical protein